MMAANVSRRILPPIHSGSVLYFIPTLDVLRLQESTLLQFGKSLAELLLRVHHDWAIPGYRLFQRLAGDQQKADAFIAGLHGHFIAAIKEHQRAIFGGGWRSGIKPSDGLCGHSQRL